LPIINKGDCKFPVVTFKCEILDNIISVSEYYVNYHALLLVLSYILQVSEREVEYSYGEELIKLYDELHNIKGQTNLTKIYHIIEKQIANSYNVPHFQRTIDLNRNKKSWTLFSGVHLTLKTADKFIPPFRDEIKLVRKLVYNSKYSELIKKYIIRNDHSKSIDQITESIYYGSYNKQYSLNLKQYKAMSAVKDSKLLAVSGPPGTGKTSLVKEIIANTFVLKTKKIIDNWSTKWKKISNGNRAVYRSPLGGNCDNSIIITSTNNKAVDNVGEELLREISYFNFITEQNNDESEYKGIFCARLGKRGNRDIFKNKFLYPLLTFLSDDEYEYDENLANKYIEEYLHNWKKIEDKIEEIEVFLCKKGQVIKLFFSECDFTYQSLLNLIKLKNDEEVSLRNKVNTLTSEIKCLRNDANASDSKVELLNSTLKEQKENLKSCENGIKKICSEKELFLKYNTTLYGKILKFFNRKISKEIKRICNKYESLSYINNVLGVKNRNQRDHEQTISNVNKKIVEIQKSIQTINNKINDLNNDLEKLKAKEKVTINDLNKLSELKKMIDSFSNIFGDAIKISNDNYDFYKSSYMLKLRHKLFELSSRINEYYITKNKFYIKHNLEIICKGNWFQPFYKPDYNYPDHYIEPIKALWESFFICFPVITTTLHSFTKDNFHMISEIFDYLIVDEAGQIIPNMLIGPLYRARKTFIFGDKFQIEPVRMLTKNLIAKTDISSIQQDDICLEKNSVQSYAERGSDIYENIDNQKIGLLLEEHRRCEESIIKFSNMHIYNNKLESKIQNCNNKFLGKNIIFLDIRGIYRNNTNDIEIKICKNIIDMLKDSDTDFYSKIGIITPFHNQAEKLKKTLNKKIETGTVHTFQGQEKDYIIFSTVIDENVSKGTKDFIDIKPNLLNVAFTRAKKQLIVVGNASNYLNGSNYMRKAFEVIRSEGYIYSIYNDSLMVNINKENVKKYLSIFNEAPSIKSDKIFEYIKANYQENIISGATEHFTFLNYIIKNAEKNIYIISPWVSHNVISDNLLQNIDEARQNRKVDITIMFGYNSTKFDVNQVGKIVGADNMDYSKEKDIVAIEKLYALLGESFIYNPPLHIKCLIVDNEIMIIGSHNWLSNSGKMQNKSKDEISCFIYDKNMIRYVKDKYFR